MEIQNKKKDTLNTQQNGQEVIFSRKRPRALEGVSYKLADSCR